MTTPLLSILTLFLTGCVTGVEGGWGRSEQEHRKGQASAVMG